MINEIRHKEDCRIYWLVQSYAALSLSLEALPSTLLSDDEQTIFYALKTDKRRHDWLLGRYATKQLVQQIARQRIGQTIPLTAFSILGRADGSPEVVWDEPSSGFDCTISISHSADRAFCALVERDEWPLGADIERIDAGIMGFIGDYLTTAERDLIDQTPDALRPLYTTTIWSAKEAVLKALRVGLKQDTRSLSCLIRPVESPPNDWTPFTIRWETWSLERPLPLRTGWWQVHDGFVLALASL